MRPVDPQGEMEFSCDQVSDDAENNNGKETEEHIEILEHDGVTACRDRAEARSLCQRADEQTCDQRCNDGRMQCTRATAGFRCGKNRGNEQGCKEQNQHHGRQYAAFRQRLRVGSLKGESFAKPERPDKNTENETNKADDGIQIPAADTEHHAKRAPQEHERADHYEDGDDKAEHRRRTAARLEFALDRRHDHCAEHKADDLGTHILYRACGMEFCGARNIAKEARDTETHIAGIAQHRQNHRNCADQSADANYGPSFFVILPLQS